MQLIIVTGMSGAGKTSVLKILEDMGYFCVDNLPPQLIGKFSEICAAPGFEDRKIGLGIDIRGGKMLDSLLPELALMTANNQKYTMIFLESSDEVLVRRFKETRRSHPLDKERVIDGISLERELLAEIKKHATHIVDTSYTLIRELRGKIAEIAQDGAGFDSLMTTVLSFGFKYGIPIDSDLVFDVRFLPNPFYEPELKPLTGNDPGVAGFVLNRPVSREFLERTGGLLEFLIPNYIIEGKNKLVVSVGCTGGKHRSVALANEIHRLLRDKGFSVNLLHRDINLRG